MCLSFFFLFPLPVLAMSNPASVYCLKTGNKLEIKTNSDGSQKSICVFKDGSTCDEMAFYKKQCGPKIIIQEKQPSINNLNSLFTEKLGLLDQIIALIKAPFQALLSR